MRLRLMTSPWWVQGLLFGSFFGAFMTLFSHYRTGSWLLAGLGGLVGGVFFGVVMGLLTSRLNARLLSELGDLAPAERQAVVRASLRGTLPTDPRQREAARSLLQRRRDQTVATRGWSIAVFTSGLALDAFLALTRSWLWWFGAALFLASLVMTAVWPARMDRRLRSFAEGR